MDGIALYSLADDISTRSDASRSASPPSRRPRATSPLPFIAIPKLFDRDQDRLHERERQMALQLAETELAGNVVKPRIDLKEEMKKMANTRAGGAYIPPHRLRAMMQDAEEENREGAEFQRLSWDALRKSINGLINKVNVSNIKMLVPEVSTFRLSPQCRG